jgi:hypothetical protein
LEATIEAYRRGEIALPPVPDKTRLNLIRHDPPDSVDHPYTKAAVAKFLGWTKKNSRGDTLQPNWECEVAFQMLELTQEGLLDSKILTGLKRVTQAEELAKRRDPGGHDRRVRARRDHAAVGAEGHTPKKSIRNVTQDSVSRPYTKAGVATFVGWTILTPRPGPATPRPDGEPTR